MFLIEICTNQNFKFLFLESEVMTLLAIALQRVGILPPLTQIAVSKIPLIEFLVKVTLFSKFFYFLGIGN